MVSTALLNGNKPFDLLSPTPSGYYANWPEIDAVNEASILAQAKQAPPSREVARRLARVVTSTSPPRKLWAGSPAWIFRWVVPLLPVAWFDWVHAQASGALKLVQRPT